MLNFQKNNPAPAPGAPAHLPVPTLSDDEEDGPSMVGCDIVTHDVAHRRSGLRAAEDEQEPEIGAVVSVEGGCGLNKSYTMSDGEDNEGEGEAVAAAGGAEPADADAPAAAAAAPAPAGTA